MTPTDEYSYHRYMSLLGHAELKLFWSSSPICYQKPNARWHKRNQI